MQSPSNFLSKNSTSGLEKKTSFVARVFFPALVLAITFLWMTLASADSMHVTDDATVNENSPSTNYGKSKKLKVSSIPEAEVVHRAYLQYNFTPIIDSCINKVLFWV